jgi:acyl carrier protein
LKDNIDPLQYPNIVSTCRERISREHGLSLHCVVLLRTRSIPKTTSGKIARSWCRKAFQEGTLNAIYRWDGDVSALDVPVVEAGGDEGDLAEGGATPEGEVSNHQGRKYAPVATGEQSGLSTAPLAVEQVRAMPLGDLVRSLELILLQISSQGPTQLSSPVDPDSPLVALGLDSMTVVQFKGVLENRYYCENIPDEFLFTPLATLKEIATAVKEGSLTSEQRRRFDAGAAAGGDPTSTTVMAQPSRKQPCCPWFTCCY